jgi:hypothetical protein
MINNIKRPLTAGPPNDPHPAMAGNITYGLAADKQNLQRLL